MVGTCPNEEHVISPLHALDLVHGDLRVAHAAFEQQGSAADHAVHQEMVLDEVEHFVRHVQGGLDAHLPGVVGHALSGSKSEMRNEPLLVGNTTPLLLPHMMFIKTEYNIHLKIAVLTIVFEQTCTSPQVFDICFETALLDSVLKLANKLKAEHLLHIRLSC